MRSASTVDDELPIVDAALLLKMDYHAARRAMLRGQLEGRRNEHGRFMVTRESVDAMLARRNSSRG